MDYRDLLAIIQHGIDEQAKQPRTIDKLNNIFSTISNEGKSLSALGKQRTENEKLQLETNKLKEGQTPYSTFTGETLPSAADEATQKSTYDRNLQLFNDAKTKALNPGGDVAPDLPNVSNPPEPFVSAREAYRKRTGFSPDATLDQVKEYAGPAKDLAQADALKNAKELFFNPKTGDYIPALPGQAAPLGYVPLNPKDTANHATAFTLAGNKLDAANAKTKKDDDLVEPLVTAIMNGDKLALSQLSARANGGALRSKVIAGILKKDPNFDFEANEANFAGKTTFTKGQNSPGFQNTMTALETIKTSIPKLQALSNKITRTDFPPINSQEMSVLKNSGDVDVAKFATAAVEVGDQIAKLFQGNGSTSDKKLGQALDILNQNFSKDQFNGVLSTIQDLIDSRKNALNSQAPRFLPSSSSPAAAPTPTQKQYRSLDELNNDVANGKISAEQAAQIAKSDPKLLDSIPRRK